MYSINNVRSSALKDIKKQERNETLLCIACGIIFAVLCTSFFI